MITAKLVKELRDKTAAGMMDCKKALEACDGDLDKAVDWLRENGISKAAKKTGRIAAEGLVKIVSNDKAAVVVELNSETDFVAKNDGFLKLIDEVANTILISDVDSLEKANDLVFQSGVKVSDAVVEATAVIGEKISFRRFAKVEKNTDQKFGLYTHFDGKTAVIALMNGGTEEVAKDIAMQIASMKPNFVSRDDIDQEFIDHERKVQEGIVANDESLAAKPEKVQKGIIEGRLSKSLQEVCLADQVFFKNPDQKVSAYLKENGAECVSFTRFIVGEGIEKKEDNFADEVASMAK